MSRIILDPAISRKTINGFAFPLGVYPVAPVQPKPGYVLEFEPADEAETFISGTRHWDPAAQWSPDTDNDPDHDHDAEPEHWPDRFMFDILVPADRVRALWRAAVSLLPPRAFPILDVLGNDAYREIDPYIAFEHVGIERFYDGVRWFEEWLFEDGLVGFGAMALDPFVYLFLDEHKILTIRVATEMKERVERLLAAMEIEETPELVGPDAAEHEHAAVLVPAKEDNDALSVEEIIERLRELWALELNIDPHTNVDDDANDLGLTAWRCVVRCTPAIDEDNHNQPPQTNIQSPDPSPNPDNHTESEPDPNDTHTDPSITNTDAGDEPPMPRYADVLLVAASLAEAEAIAAEAAATSNAPESTTPKPTPSDKDADTHNDDAPQWADITLVAQDRITLKDMKALLNNAPTANLDAAGPRLVEWLDLPPEAASDHTTRPHPQATPRSTTPPTNKPSPQDQNPTPPHEPNDKPSEDPNTKENPDDPTP